MTKRPTFWSALWVLLGAARKRATGRQRRQQELLNQRSGGNGTDWGAIGTVLTAVFMIVVNVVAVFVLRTAVSSAQRVEVEQQGKIVVSETFLQGVSLYQPHTYTWRDNQGRVAIPAGKILKIEDTELDRMDWLVEGVDGSAKG